MLTLAGIIALLMAVMFGVLAGGSGERLDSWVKEQGGVDVIATRVLTIRGAIFFGELMIAIASACIGGALLFVAGTQA